MSVSISHVNVGHNANHVWADFGSMLVGELTQIAQILYGSPANKYPKDIGLIQDQLASHSEAQLPEGLFVLQGGEYTIVVYGASDSTVPTVYAKIEEILAGGGISVNIAGPRGLSSEPHN